MVKKKLKIFIIEDEIDRAPRNAILDALAGHSLTVAKTLEEGKKMFQLNHPFDLWILDHDMRGYPEPSVSKYSAYNLIPWIYMNTGRFSVNETPIILHSQNTTGRKAMRLKFTEYGFNNIYEFSFGPKYVDWLKETYGLVKE